MIGPPIIRVQACLNVHVTLPFLVSLSFYVILLTFRLLKAYKKIHKFSSVISFFCTNEWIFTNNNVQALWRKLDRKDQELFNFDMKSMDWKEYSHHYIKGMRLYLFKDDLSTVESARRKWNRYVIFRKISSKC